MQFSTSVKALPRLPRGLVLLLLLSFIGQLGGQAVPRGTVAPALPPLTAPRWEKRRRGQSARYRAPRRFAAGRWLGPQVPRLLARMSLLAVLLSTSGWPAVTRLSWGIVLLPMGPLLLTTGLLTQPARPGRSQWVRWLARLQRLYQLTLGLLLLSSLVRLLGHPLSALAVGVVGLPASGCEWTPSAADATDLRVTTSGEHHFEVTWRGTFQLVWEPRDGFEKWLLVLFVRRCHRLGETQPWLSQAQVAAAFGTSATYVSR